jgi:hypothetical protein
VAAARAAIRAAVAFRLRGSAPRATDLALGSALQSFVELTAEQFPVSYAKAETMRAAFTEHGFTSYF